MSFTEPLEPDTFYHIYNRANGNELLFSSRENYMYFLKRYTDFILPIADTFCYCLMPNHFHFLIKIKPEKTLMELSDFSKYKIPEILLSKYFSNFFSSYALSYNKQQGRKGSLFIKKFKRKKISDEKYLHRVIHYIHYNPVEAALCTEPQQWQFSSYKAIISDKQTLIKKKEVIDWFGDLENFIYCHKHPPSITGID
jgi:putative transposase